MLFFFCFVSVYLSQIVDVNLSVNSNWTEYQLGSYNLTYNVTETNSPYISVHILLTQQNPNFMMVSKFGSPVTNFNQSFIQGQSIDIISVLENRLSRFLLIPAKNFPIYISTLDETTKSSYQITIQANDFITCDNNCSNNGQCNDKGCVCDSGFIGNDCHQKAEEINEQSETQIFLQNHSAFFYIELRQYLGNKMILDFEIDQDDEEVFIYQLKTYTVVLPTELQNIDERMFQQYTLNTSNPLTLFFDIPQNITSNKRLIFAALSQKAGQIQNDNTLIVSLKFEKKESSVETYVIVISIVIPIVLVILLAAFIVYKLKKKKEMTELAESQRREHYLAPTFSIPQVPTDFDRHLIQVNQKEVNPDETCSICLENLVCNGKDLISTLCMHTFHRSCIISWTQNHKECPICRSNLIPGVPIAQV